MHRAPNLAQPAHQARTGMPRRARAWPCRGQPSVVSWSRPWPCRRRRAPYRKRCQRRVVGVGAVSQRAVPRAWLPCPGLAVLYCNTTQSFALASCHNTPRCIAIQMPSLSSSSSSSHNTISVLRYNFVLLLAPLCCNTNSPLSQPPNYIAIQFPPRPVALYCNTLVVLQYNFPHAAIQSSHLFQYTFTSLAASKSQYNTLYCNTIWAVAQPTFAPHFFFRFSLLFIFFFFSILFPATGNTKKISIHFFFHFSSSTPNNFIKIYFLHFL